MVQGYYTLEEASRILGLNQEKLSHMAQKREVRAFADRGTWRFRTQDIEELARQMGLGSNPDLQLGEAPTVPKKQTSGVLRKTGVKPGDSAPKSGPKTPVGPATGTTSGKGDDPSIFDFDTNSADQADQIDFGMPISKDSASAGRKSGKPAGPLSPAPQAGSDSDVKLVSDGSDVDFSIPIDSDPKMNVGGPKTVKPTPPPSSSKGGQSRTGMKPGEGPAGPPSSMRKKTGMTPPPTIDSGVRLVPMDEDISVPVNPAPRTGKDSDVRLESDRNLLSGKIKSPGTEEMDLDAELQQAEQAAKGQKPRSKFKPKTKVPPVRSPGEETTILPPGDEVALGALSPGRGGESGINLSKPADSGINLEQGDSNSGEDKIEFELSLDDVGATPKPGSAAAGADSSSEFELSLDGEDLAAPASEGAGDDSSSEFELSLDAENTPKPAKAGSADSDSEFELTLDDSGVMASEEGGEQPDIFETDFEAPGMEEGSESEAVALEDGDTSLESSDFDLSLSEEESGSQVVALDDEEAEEGAATVAGPLGVEDDEAADEVDELLEEDAAAEDAEEAEGSSHRAVAVAAPPANWGILPVLLMVPCVLVMFLLGLMSWELLHGMWGYKEPYQPTGMVAKWVAETFGGEKMP